MALLSMRAYAKQRGVSPEAVSKAAKLGRISTVVDPVTGKRKVDPAVADLEWGQNSDPAKLRDKPAPPPPPDEDEAEKQTGPSYAKARGIREAFAAKIAQLDFQERSGRLVPADAVRARWTSIAGIVRTRVLGIPTKIRQQIPGISAEEYVLIEAIVFEALEELSNGGS